MKAPECAGIIHTDFQKGFIKAEVMSYDDLISAGSEAKVKKMVNLELKVKSMLCKMEIFVILDLIYRRNNER